MPKIKIHPKSNYFPGKELDVPPGALKTGHIQLKLGGTLDPYRMFHVTYVSANPQKKEPDYFWVNSYIDALRGEVV